MPTVTLVAGSLILKKRAAHLVQVIGDNGVQTRPHAAPMAPGDDGDATPGLLCSELVSGELGRQCAQPLAQEVCGGGHASLLFPPLRLTSSIRPNGTRFPAPGQLFSRTRSARTGAYTKSTN